MSARSTMLLTKDNEHWYHDCIAMSNQGAKTDDAIVLEFGKQHKITKFDDGNFEVLINEDTELYKKLYKAFREEWYA